jgi:phytanoyl-CoA dioxygenase PhyH
MIRRLVNAFKRRIPKPASAPPRAICAAPSVPVITKDLIVDVDWAAMSPSEQAAFYDENGFLVVSQAISREDLAIVHHEIKSYGLTGLTADIWSVPSFAPLIENRKLLSALRTIFGEEIRFFKGAYVETPPIAVAGEKARPKVFHVDYGVGESGGDFRNSCASWVNVGLYLTDMTPELAPFWVVPGSNRHYDVVPSDDMESMADQAKIVLAKAGDAVFIHCMTVHAGGHNLSNTTRHAIFLSYRPAWARPVGRVPEWPKEFIDKAPAKRKPLLLGLNQGL